MQPIQQKFKSRGLLDQISQNKNDLAKKTQQNLIPKLYDYNLSRSKIIYDTNWLCNELEYIDGAVTTTYELELPQKVPYDFSFDLKIPESYLPFLTFDVLAKTTPTQNIVGVGEYIYSSLKPVHVQLYDWAGNTSVEAVADLSPSDPLDNGFGWWMDEGSPPSVPPVGLPDPEIAIPHLPKPSSAYETYSAFTEISIPSWYIPGGRGPWDLNKNGSEVYYNDEWVSLSSWATIMWNLYHNMYGQVYFYVTAYSATYFIPEPVLNFPIPVGDKSYSFPNGTTTDTSNCDEYWGSQYWVTGDLEDFNDYVTLVGYNEAKNTFIKYYPDIVYTAEEDGPPYNAYESSTTEVVQSCEQQIIIDKIAKDNFRFRIRGYLLLVSKSTVETEYSDPILPTYQPNGEDMYVRLKVYYDSWLHQFNLINYKK